MFHLLLATRSYLALEKLIVLYWACCVHLNLNFTQLVAVVVVVVVVVVLGTWPRPKRKEHCRTAAGIAQEAIALSGSRNGPRLRDLFWFANCPNTKTKTPFSVLVLLLRAAVDGWRPFTHISHVMCNLAWLRKRCDGVGIVEYIYIRMPREWCNIGFGARLLWS